MTKDSCAQIGVNWFEVERRRFVTSTLQNVGVAIDYDNVYVVIICIHI